MTRFQAYRQGRAALAAILAMNATACFAYQALPKGSPPGQEVRVSLDPAEIGPLTSALGPRAGVLEGSLVGRTDTTVTIAVRSITRTGGDEERWGGDAVVLPLGTVQRIERRRVSVVRTVLAVGGVAVAAALTGRLASEGTGTGIGRTVPGQGQ